MKSRAWMMAVGLVLTGGVAHAGQTAAPPAKAAPQKAVGTEKKEGLEPEADEAKVALKNLPPAVRATVEAETKNATIKGISKETAKGKTVYEVESLVNGRTRDFMIDGAGKVYVVEEQLDVDKAPAAVRRALESHGTIVVLESVMQHGATTFEGQVKTKAGKKFTMELDAAGKPVKK
jgi:uncharacterized membrane protein YkoI